MEDGSLVVSSKSSKTTKTEEECEMLERKEQVKLKAQHARI